MGKTTNSHLPKELRTMNKGGRYNSIIERCLLNHFHDFKSPLPDPCPKVLLVGILGQYPELSDMRQRVIDGEYDESPDEADKADLRKYLPENMWPLMGLD